MTNVISNLAKSPIKERITSGQSRFHAHAPKLTPRILHLVETFEIGGTETQAVETALRQHAAGQNVTIGCLRKTGPLLRKLQIAGIHVVEFRKDKRLFSLQGFRELVRLARFLHRQRFTVVHAHDLMSNLLGIPAARLAGTPIVISSRRYLAELDWWNTRWRHGATRLIYRLSSYVVVNSATIKHLLVNRDRVSPAKVRVIYNAVDVDHFLIPADRKAMFPQVKSFCKLIAVVANMYSPIKGHAAVISAAVKVCREYSNAVFVLIGDGRERATLERQVKQADLENNILFLGSRDDVPNILACCDLSVLGSESEGFPNSVLEAMAAALPVVATAVGGVPEIIENEVSGLVVGPRDSIALSAAILRLLKDDELCQRMAKAARERVLTRFSFARLSDSLKDLYTGHPEPDWPVAELHPAV